jgi:hypothetical protein
MEIPKELIGKELHAFLKENKSDLIYAKKSAIKTSDSISSVSLMGNNIDAKKGFSNDNKDEIKVRAIINTTNVIDSHKDVHLDGIWNKSLKENKNIKFLQEHKMSFKTIIADRDDLKVSSNNVSWKSLGYDFEGKTDALTFDATIKRNRNKEMFKEYSEGNVDNHSVGMQYVKMELALYSEDEDYEEEKAVWDKYIDKIANKDVAIKSSYFWAVSEAKVIEGSAVVMGSNSFTPTIQSDKETKEIIETKDNAIVEWLKNN